MGLNLGLQDQIWIISGTFGGVVLIIALTVVIMILKVASLKSELKGFERYSPEENFGFQEDRNQRQQPAGEYRRGDSESDELEKLGFKIYGGAGGAGAGA